MTAGPAAILAATRKARLWRLVRRVLLWSSAFCGVAALSLALALGWLKVYTDGAQIEQRAHEAVLRNVLWEAPVEVDARVNRVRGNRDACLSPDGQTLVFAREFSPGNVDLFVQRRIGEDWSAPQRMQGVNSLYNDHSPAFSPDGNQLFLTSDRPGGFGALDIWVTRRDEDGWTKAENLGAAINTTYDDLAPSPDAARRGLYFTTNRPAGTAGTNTSRNIFFAYYDEVDAETGAPIAFRPAFEMRVLNSKWDEGKVVSASRGDVLYLVSERAGGLGGRDLYRSLRVEGDFQTPTNLGQPVNSVLDESAPSVHPDGFRLYFNSNRLSRTGNDYTLFEAVSREVLVRIDYDLLTYLLVCLLLAAIALLAINHLLQLFFNSQSSLKLIPLCLLASLLFHVLLLTLSGMWYLRSKIEQALESSPQEMTINVNALARESIGLAIRESVGALPAVQSSASSALPAPSWESASSSPASEPTPVAAGLPDAGESAPSPLQTEVFQQVRAANPSVAATSPQNFHEPFEMGPTAVTMEEMPRGASSAGSPNASASASGSPTSELAEAAGTTSRPALLEGPRGSGPESFSTAQTGSSEAAETAVKDGAGASDATSSWKSHLNANQNDGQQESRTADALAEATGARSRSSAESSLGSFILPVGLVLETPDAGAGGRAAELGLLTQDPYRIVPTDLETIERRRWRFSQLLRGGSLDEVTQAVLAAFKRVDHGKGGYEPGRVGEVVAGAVPGLLLPADSELEVPEAYLD
ncbi:MAG: hypothetical protein ACFB20_12645 [Opitutales bacterium]